MDPLASPPETGGRSVAAGGNVPGIISTGDGTVNEQHFTSIYAANGTEIVIRPEALFHYHRAVDQLGSGEPAVVMGGIRALAMIMAGIAPDQLSIPQQLADVIRARTGVPGAPVIVDGPGEPLNSITLDVPVAVTTAELIDFIGAANKRPRRFGRRLKGHQPLLPAAIGTVDPVVQAAMSALATRPTGPASSPLDLRQACLAGIKLTPGSRFAGTYFTAADLRDAQLPHAELAQAWFRQAALSGAALPGADLSGARLSQADLRYAGLSRACLTGAALTLTDLSGADLAGADLTSVCGWKANLSKTRLRRARLCEALLIMCDLSHSDVDIDTDFTGAHLNGSNLSLVFGLTVDHLLQAEVDEGTVVDPALASDPQYIAHLDRCRALQDRRGREG